MGTPMSEKAAEQPQNLLWAIDEIITALQKLREQVKRLASEAKN